MNCFRSLPHRLCKSEKDMKRLLLILPMGLMLSGCVTAAQLNVGIPGDSASADASAPADPCPDQPAPPGEQARATAPSSNRLAPPPTTRAGGQMSDIDLGIALISASSGAGGRAGGDPGVRVYSTDVQRTLGFNLAQFGDQLDNLDSTGSADADKTLSSPGFVEATTVNQTSSSRAVGGQPIRLSRSEWLETTKLIARTTSEDGWTASFAESLGRFAKADGVGARSAGQRQVALDDLSKKYLLAAYMAAYFRNGQIFSLEFNQAGLKDKLLAKLKDTIKDDNTLKAADGVINDLAADYEKALCDKGKSAAGNCVLLGVIGEKTFVTRAGKSYGFPGITATVDATADKKISTNKVAADDVVADLVRVVFEAGGDAAFKVPGARNSTLCDFDGRLCATDAEAAKLQTVNDTGDKVEAGATTAVGAAIRGGWLFSLNNEYLAKSITTAVAVGLRKSAEGIAWKTVQGTCPSNRASATTLYRTVNFRIAR